MPAIWNGWRMKAVGVDIGSSALKTCLFDLSTESAPAPLAKHILSCPLSRPSTGRAEHDLARLEPALKGFLDKVPPECPVGITSAMHGLVLLDESSAPLCGCIAWADGRGAEQAAQLRKAYPAAHARTGTPLHPMAWPAKLLWVKQCSPLWPRVRRITDLKGYLLERLVGGPCPIDLSSATGTGLWNSEKMEWDAEFLEFLGVPRRALPEVAIAPETLAWRGRTVHLAAGDGPIGNLGVGAVTPGRVAVSLGTSGAIRQLDPGHAPLEQALFRYALDRRHWVIGGAISNGTSVFDWLRLQRDLSVEEMVLAAKQAHPGSLGLRVYPYFSGERAPFWKAGVRSHIVGWSFQHRFHHLVRATMEGVAYCLRRILDRMEPPSEPLRCTGGFFTSKTWRQLLADVTQTPVAVSPVREATALGAALMTLPDYLERSARLPLGLVTEPGEHSPAYQDLYAEWAQGEPNR